MPLIAIIHAAAAFRAPCAMLARRYCYAELYAAICRLRRFRHTLLPR